MKTAKEYVKEILLKLDNIDLLIIEINNILKEGMEQCK